VDGPAEQCGQVRAGDVLVSIDRIDVRDMSAEDIAQVRCQCNSNAREQACMQASTPPPLPVKMALYSSVVCFETSQAVREPSEHAVGIESYSCHARRAMMCCHADNVTLATLVSVEQYILGPPGSRVRLGFVRAGSALPYYAELTRGWTMKRSVVARPQSVQT
jgi:hypothetical protein